MPTVFDDDGDEREVRVKSKARPVAFSPMSIRLDRLLDKAGVDYTVAAARAICRGDAILDEDDITQTLVREAYHIHQLAMRTIRDRLTGISKKLESPS